MNIEDPMLSKPNDEVMLTTIDNPFDPFTKFDEWLAFDQLHGYNCWSKVARISNIDFDSNELEKENKVDEAIDFLVDTLPNLYMKVHPGDRRYEPGFDFSKELESMRVD